MIGDLFFVCPRCGCFHCVRKRRRKVTCVRCAVGFERRGDRVRVGDSERPAWEWFDQIVGALDGGREERADVPLVPGERVIAVSEPGRARRAAGTRPFRGFGPVRAPVEGFEAAGEVRLVLTDRRLLVKGAGTTQEIPLEELACVTTDAREFVLRQRGQAALHVEFPQQSPLFWELATQRALAAFWAQRGREVVEFQPWVRFRDRERPVDRSRVLVNYDRRAGHPRDTRWNEFLYASIRAVARRFFRFWFGLELVGAERLPGRGPYFLIVNHEGYLDSFFVLAALPVKIGFLAKNTEFKPGINWWAMRLFRSIPVHRHRPDPVALRNVLRLLRSGAPVAAFPEGERTWDGRRLKSKRTLVKLMMRSGVPIVPCRISGSFRVMPRWDHSPQRHRVTIRVGEPFRVPEEITDIDAAIDFVGRKLDELADPEQGGERE